MMSQVRWRILKKLLKKADRLLPHVVTAVVPTRNYSQRLYTPKNKKKLYLLPSVPFLKHTPSAWNKQTTLNANQKSKPKISAQNKQIKN